MEVELKMDYLIKEIPPDIKLNKFWNALVTKMRELTKNKCFNEDIAALHVNKSEIVQANVPKEIVNSFYHSHQRLRALNVTIQTLGWIMEESAYGNYEDPRDVLKELFPKSGLLEEDKQRMLEFMGARDEGNTAYSAFVEHPAARELLQGKTLSQIDKMWIQVLPIMNQYLKNIEHVISLWRARYQFETKLSIYVRNRSKLETLLESINNIG